MAYNSEYAHVLVQGNIDYQLKIERINLSNANPATRKTPRMLAIINLCKSPVKATLTQSLLAFNACPCKDAHLRRVCHAEPREGTL